MDGSTHLNTPIFKTKAQTLQFLQGKVKSADILPLLIFSVNEWAENSEKCLESTYKLCHTKYIVRSSSLNEDTANSSNAGAFLSLLNIDKDGLSEAINKVIGSYTNKNLEDEILIQPMLNNVVQSGVMFTHDPNTCSPYRVINWSEGDNTEGVTSGGASRLIHHAADAPVQDNRLLQSLIPLAEELLIIYGDLPLDIEFALTSEYGAYNLWLLQVRPLILAKEVEPNYLQTQRLKVIEEKIKRGMVKHPDLIGSKTVYGVMPDWNPAEIVGIRPRPLSLSLYREMVTDSIWAYQRDNYGYRNLRSFPLMSNFFGVPYIDVRLSFNSFIPADIDDCLAGKLVDYYIDRLLEKPALHDKVEFDIVISCYTLDIEQKLEKLTNYGFSSEECLQLSNSLRNLTNKIIHPLSGLWKTDKAKIEILKKRREKIMQTKFNSIERIYWLLEDCKRYGTLPFAGLARAGFISIQILKSLVNIGIFSSEYYDSFLENITTISSQMSHDRSNLDKATFLSEYGHLRPGTYDILSLRYDEAPDLYFDWKNKLEKPTKTSVFSLTLSQMKDITLQLENHKLGLDTFQLLDFLQQGIELRETAKFFFSRNLSDALSLIVKFGESYGISRDDISYCDINVFKEMYIGAGDSKKMLLQSIEKGKMSYAETKKISLPPLITDAQSVWSFEWPETEPNFITQKEITAPVAISLDKNFIANKIVCISNADPGFDWLFGYPIAGLITCWGGANSHMAIRAGELSLPAVIGCGDVLFNKWCASNILYVNCSNRIVNIVS